MSDCKAQRPDDCCNKEDCPTCEWWEGSDDCFCPLTLEDHNAVEAIAANVEAMIAKYKQETP